MISVSELKIGMTIIEYDPYGNNVYKVLSEPKNDNGFISVQVEDMDGNELTIGENPDYMSLQLAVIS